MTINARIAALTPEMTLWRRHLHAHPETAFEEHATAAFVAERLAAFGLAVDRGLAGTGVVGTLSTGDGPTIGLRADMDALHISEQTGAPHASTIPGKMHACGHDGHTAMLLGAARYLAESKRFRGTVHFIFQPAEENEGGGRVMIEEGLFERFPMRAVYGLHNWPGMPAGVFAVRDGPTMAACDSLEIVITGKGCHAAMPHLGVDPIVAAAATVSALQTVVSRAIDPQESAVVSITQVHAGDTWNVIPDTAVIRGTARCFTPAVRDRLEAAVGEIAGAVASAHGCRAEVRYCRQYPPTVNDAREAARCAEVAARVVGAERVVRNPPPTMGSEDFGFMLEKTPGCYVWLGSGNDAAAPTLHNARYDFNDAVLAIGASYWATLVETTLNE